MNRIASLQVAIFCLTACNLSTAETETSEAETNIRTVFRMTALESCIKDGYSVNDCNCYVDSTSTRLSLDTIEQFINASMAQEIYDLNSAPLEDQNIWLGAASKCYQ